MDADIRRGEAMVPPEFFIMRIVADEDLAERVLVQLLEVIGLAKRVIGELLVQLHVQRLVGAENECVETV